MFDTYLLCSISGRPISHAATISPVYSNLANSYQQLSHTILTNDTLGITQSIVAILYHRDYLVNPQRYNVAQGRALVIRLSGLRSLNYWSRLGSFIQDSKEYHKAKSIDVKFAWDKDNVGGFFQFLTDGNLLPEIVKNGLNGEEELRDQLRQELGRVSVEDESTQQHVETTRKQLEHKMRLLDKRVNTLHQLSIHLYNRLAYLDKGKTIEIAECSRVLKAVDLFSNDKLDYPHAVSLLNYIGDKVRWQHLANLVSELASTLRKAWLEQNKELQEDNKVDELIARQNELKDDRKTKALKERMIKRVKKSSSLSLDDLRKLASL